MYVYLLILVLTKRQRLGRSAYEILQILSVSAFIKMSLLPLFLNDSTQTHISYSPNQLLLFGLSSDPSDHARQIWLKCYCIIEFRSHFVVENP